MPTIEIQGRGHGKMAKLDAVMGGCSVPINWYGKQAMWKANTHAGKTLMCTLAMSRAAEMAEAAYLRKRRDQWTGVPDVLLREMWDVMGDELRKDSGIPYRPLLMNVSVVVTDSLVRWYAAKLRRGRMNVWLK